MRYLINSHQKLAQRLQKEIWNWTLQAFEGRVDEIGLS